jgi:hypothetical protein
MNNNRTTIGGEEKVHRRKNKARAKEERGENDEGTMNKCIIKKDRRF